MREIILDTETTGLDPALGDRLVEIACLELVNQIPTANRFQRYLNPERDVPDAAVRVHGLNDQFLRDKPKFAEVAEEFLTFIGDAPLVIHNAEFDLDFINAELARIGRPTIPLDRAIDTVKIARRKFPGSPASLDALCKRFMIDNSGRTLHGALLDAELLAEVYLMLMGGRQVGLGLGLGPGAAQFGAGGTGVAPAPVTVRTPRPHAPSAEERARHSAFIGKLTNPIWNE
jgi:DNA polymerase-3 subunit epsilon